MGQHVVVHVDGGAVVDWVSQTLGEDGLACVRRQAKQEEASLSCRKPVDRLSKNKKKCNYSFTVLVHFCIMATLPCRLWWFETSASCQPGWKAVWTCQKQNAGRALAPHWWTPPSSPRTSQLAGGSRWCRGNAPASSASLRRPLADRRPAVPAAAPSAGRGGARGWWWTCPLWLLPPGHNRTRSALMLLTTIGLLSGR